MRILFDNGTPNAIAKSLAGHQVDISRDIGWEELVNGELIQKAEDAGYELLLTTDKRIQYQQNLSSRRIALVVLGYQQWPVVRLHLHEIVEAVESSTPGSYIEVEIPFSRTRRPWPRSE